MKSILALLLSVVGCLAQLSDPAFLASLTTPAATGSWTPQTPSNTLVEWLKADAITGKVDGDALAVWTATTGTALTNDSHASWSPIYKTSIKNSLPVVRFGGLATTNHLHAAFGGGSISEPYTVCVVFRYVDSSLTSSEALFSGYANDVRFMNRSDSNFKIWANNPVDYSTLQGSDNNWHIVLLEYNTTSSKFRFDGNGEAAPTGGAVGTQAMDGLTLGALEGTVGFYGEFDIGEVAIWSGSLSSTDKTGWFAYANAKWAVY